MFDSWSQLQASWRRIALNHCLSALRDNSVGTQTVWGAQEHSNTITLYLFAYWHVSYMINPPCSNRPGRPSDTSIIQPTICMVPESFCHRYCGRGRGRGWGWWCRIQFSRGPQQSPQAWCGRTTGTSWPTQLDTRANRYLPVWASTDNTPRETARNLRDLVKV